MKRAELKNLIKALGGPKAVGRAFNISSQAVSHWDRVPVEYCPTIERMASEKKLVRSDGTRFTCELFQPEVEWAAIRGVPQAPITVPEE